MIIVDAGGSIAISRGDTAALTISFDSDTPLDGARAIVTLKRSASDAAALWAKEYTVADGSITVVLGTEDTAHPFGRYVWDVRLICGDTVITPMPPKCFRIAEVVGDV